MTRPPRLYRLLHRMRRSRGLRVLGSVALVGLLIALWSAWDHEAILEWKQQAGPLPFFVAMALLPALGFPMTPFFVLAGATFGTRVGVAGSTVALAVNLLLCYWIANSALRPRIAHLVNTRTRFELPDFSARGRRVLRFTMLVRAAPGIPLFIKNYLLGLAGVPLPMYFAVSMLFSCVYGYAFVVLGESLLEHDLRQAAAALAVLLGAAGAVWLWRRRRTPDTNAHPPD